MYTCRLFIPLLVLLYVNHACKTRVTTGADSDLAEIKLNLPANEDEHRNKLFEAYSLSITTADAKCKNWELAHAEAASSQAMAINDVKLKNDCDYLIVLELGKLADVTDKVAAKGNKKSLSKAIYSNVVNNNKGKVITSKELKAAKTALEVKIIVYKIDGSQSGPDRIETPDTASVNIDVDFGGDKDAMGSLNLGALQQIMFDKNISAADKRTAINSRWGEKEYTFTGLVVGGNTNNLTDLTVVPHNTHMSVRYNNAIRAIISVEAQIMALQGAFDRDSIPLRFSDNMPLFAPLKFTIGNAITFKGKVVIQNDDQKVATIQNATLTSVIKK